MEILVTQEVLSRLGITGSAIISNVKKYPFPLLSFSRTHISFISSEQTSELSNPLSAQLRTNTDEYHFDLTYETSVKTSTKHWIHRFVYSPESIESPLKDKWLSMLTIKDFQQMRKETRIQMNTKNVLGLRLRNYEIQVWVHDAQKTCLLHDLSFSGARFFCTDDLILDSDDKVTMKISFINPSEISTVRAVVIRKRNVDISGIPCIDTAVRFLEPVDIVLLSRLTFFFQNNHN